MCDSAFKERAVKLSYERSSITDLASECGILPNRIYSCRKEFANYGSASFPGHGVERLSDEGRRVEELKKKLKNTEFELEILKKAIATTVAKVRGIGSTRSTGLCDGKGALWYPPYCRRDLCKASLCISK